MPWSGDGIFTHRVPVTRDGGVLVLRLSCGGVCEVIYACIFWKDLMAIRSFCCAGVMLAVYCCAHLMPRDGVSYNVGHRFKVSIFSPAEHTLSVDGQMTCSNILFG